MQAMHSQVSRIVLVGIVLFAGSLPCFAARGPLWHSVMDYGAAADGTSKDTAAIEGAINAAARAGGGTIYFPAGRYLTWPIHLKSNDLRKATSVCKIEGGFPPSALIRD